MKQWDDALTDAEAWALIEEMERRWYELLEREAEQQEREAEELDRLAEELDLEGDHATDKAHLWDAFPHDERGQRDGWDTVRVESRPPDLARFSDPNAAVGLVEFWLGAPIEDIRRIYTKPGRPSAADLALRDQMDAKLLALWEWRERRPRRDDLTVTDVARIIGMREREDGSFEALTAALRRARERRNGMGRRAIR